MDCRQAEAYNAGVTAMAELARASADRLAVRERASTGIKMAVAALDGLADGAAALRLPERAPRK